MDALPLLERLRGRERGPAVRLLGHRLLDCDEAARSVRVAYEARPEFCNPMGQVQGGFLSAMLEQAMVDAVYCAAGLDAGAVTLELEVHFLASARPGMLLADGRVTRLGRSIAFLAAELQDESGTQCLSGSAVAILQSPSTSGE
jgi:uncharacterized protein (TIGR00369 family)